MKTTTIKSKVFLTFVAICLVIAGMAVAFNMTSFNSVSVYAMEQKEFLLEEETGQENLPNEEEVENIMMLSGGGGRSDEEGIISGTTTSTLSFSDLTSVHYIPNANYFLTNPWHHGLGDGVCDNPFP